MRPVMMPRRLVREWRGRLEPLRLRLAVSWAQRTPRERILLCIAAALVLCAGCWFIGVRPALDTIARVQTQLPGLQARAAQLDAIILEAEALGRERQGVLSATETGRALETSLESAGLGTSGGLTSIAETGGDLGRWRLALEDAPAARVLSWMASLPAIAQLRVLRVDIARSVVDGRDRPGRLTGEVLLALPARENP
ncbi:type II secretion system protein GspM [Castellaniella sp. GW247-6E4]|uniref:type II secretion system protein GspM n=1 Tax=Castellaniella sp. GW247-6E4 TaxID=3140380 RepID=UPI003315EFA0